MISNSLRLRQPSCVGWSCFLCSSGRSLLHNDHLYLVVAVTEHNQGRNLLFVVLRVGYLRWSPSWLRRRLWTNVASYAFRVGGLLTPASDRRVIASCCHAVRMLRLVLSRRRRLVILSILRLGSTINRILRIWLIYNWRNSYVLCLRLRCSYIGHIIHIVDIWLGYYLRTLLMINRLLLVLNR